MPQSRSVDLTAVKFKQAVDLQSLNSMALPALAAHYVAITEAQQLPACLTFAQQRELPIWILGGGSNVIFTDDYPGLVIHMLNTGIELVKEDDSCVWVKVAAGEVWDDFLQHCIAEQWYGLENLAIIPGTVGAAPVQNIGAYGQEVADCIVSVECLERQSLKVKVLDKEQCQFSYRDSLFKTQAVDEYVITAVTFCLHKQFVANTTYKPLAQHFSGRTPSAFELRKMIIDIRRSKLPEPQNIANSGSFFKNPVVSLGQYKQLQTLYPPIPGYVVADGVKLAAGWLIEQCGWKGRALGPVAMYEKQALVLVNLGQATFSDVQGLVTHVQADVEKQFQVRLEQEPVLVV